MDPASVVLFQKDAGVAKALASRLSQKIQPVYVARTREEIRPTIAQHRARVLVFDLENSCLDEVERLHQEFPALSIVCTHRLADDELWTAALTQGAADMCEPGKPEDVVSSVMREQRRAIGAAA